MTIPATCQDDIDANETSIKSSMDLIELLKKMIARLLSAFPDRISASYMRFNKRIFQGIQARRGKQVLFELNTIRSSHIAYGYLANVLAARDGASIAGYLPFLRSRRAQRLSFGFDRMFGVKELGIHDSFGMEQCITPVLSAGQEAASRKLFEEIVGRLKSKWDVENLTVEGIWIGDLVYDTYLMQYKQPTILLGAPDFLVSLKASIDLFIFWNDYITADTVSAINVSHCVYNQALPLRIGVAKGIPVYQSNLTHIYRLSKKAFFAYNDFFYFRERFTQFPREIQMAGLKEAERRIKRRFSGEVGVDMRYSSKSAYGKFKEYRLIRPSQRKKILIATHCFFDSPHSYGNNLFPDFYEWLDFLGQMSLSTDYDWYIKTHPDYLPGTMEIINGFIEKYPKLTLLPADSSHHQIIAEGIDLALTVYGTIGFEYAALGIPVINASINNPHIAYDFNLHPKSLDEYKQMLMGIDTLQLNIDKTQVYEYYFMACIFNTHHLFFDDYEQVIEEMSGYDAQFTPAIYKKWMEQWSPEKHASIMAAIEKFIQSGDFRMDYRHFGYEFSLDSIGSKE